MEVIAAAEVAGLAIEAGAPFAGVAEHVVEAPGVGLFLFDLMGLFFGILFGPGRVVGGFGHIAASAAGVFPFGDGGQAIFLLGFFAQPFAIHFGRKMGSVDELPGVVGRSGV